MKMIVTLCRRLMERSVLNPLNWAVWAVLIIATWCTLHLLGWRTDTGVISGTADPSGGHAYWAMMRGVWYAGAYFGAVLVSPILLLAAVLYFVGVKAFTCKHHSA